MRHPAEQPGADLFSGRRRWGLRWFRDRTSPDALARDHGISRVTAYRYLDEVIVVLADEAPDLREALERSTA